MRPYVVLERVSRVTPLGIRFVDQTTGRDVSESLVVEVYEADHPERRVEAQRNRSGRFFVTQLPGPRDAASEFGDGGPEFWAGVRQRAFVIEVHDRQGQFQPFTLEQRLPAQALAMPACLAAGSPPLDHVPLFSAPARMVPSGTAVIRAELSARVTRPDGSTANIAAAWAVLAATVAGQSTMRGVADREGRVAILTPYPEPVTMSARLSSPPFGAGTGLWDQEWPVRLEAFFEPLAPPPAVPDLCRTLAQGFTRLWTDVEATRPVSGLVLQYGRELIVPALIVGPVGPPA